MWLIWIPAGAAVLFLAQVAILRRMSAAEGFVWSSRWQTIVLALAIVVGTMSAGMFGPLASLGAGVGLNVLVGGRMLQTTRRGLRVRRLLARLDDASPELATATLAALEHEVEGLRGGRGGEKSDYEHRARWVLAIASSAARAGHATRALDWTTRIEPGLLGRPAAAMHAQHEAAFRIGTLDRQGARAAIARAPRPAIAPWEDALQALDALLEALDGDGQAAADRASRALDATPKGPSRPTWQMARAHGLAKVGSMEDARETLLTLRTEGGDTMLRRMVAHAGPASRLAETILTEQGAYR